MKSLVTPLKQQLTDAKKRYQTAKESGDIVQTVIIVAMFVAIVMFVGSMLFKAISKQTKKISDVIASSPASPSTTQSASTTTTGAAQATTQATSQPTIDTIHTTPAIASPVASAPEFPWSMVLGSLFSLVLVSVIIFLIVFFIRKNNAARMNRKNLRLDWEKLMARHDSVRKTWSTYELDLVKIIASPLMSDMRNPLTVALHTALRNADMARPANIPNASHKAALGSRYELAVISLEEAFQKAENESRRVKWGNYSTDEKKRLRKAQDLLSLAMNDGATEFERQAAYKGLRKELDGLLVIPDTAVAAIEAKVRLMVEA